MTSLDVSWLPFMLILNSVTGAIASDWVDPELMSFSRRGSFQSDLEYCQNELSVCRKLKTIQIDDSATKDTMEQMKIIIGNWMFMTGMQSFQLPMGDKRSVPVMLTLSDTDLKLINTYLNEPTYKNFVSTVPTLNRFFTLNRNSYQNMDGANREEPNLLHSKEKWVKIIFNVIMSCMNKETMLVVTCLIVAGFLLKAMIFGADIRVIVGMFIVGVFFAGFLWNWCYMYQKAVVDQYVKRVKYEKYASSCKPDDSFFGFFKSLFGYTATIDECTEYFRGVEIDPLIMVPPTLALSETISMFIIHPAILMAESMEKITKILFGNMVWGRYFGTPIVMIVFGAMFLTLFIVITGQSVKIKILYFGSIEVGSPFNYYSPISHRQPNNMIDDRASTSTTVPALLTNSTNVSEPERSQTTPVRQVPPSFSEPGARTSTSVPSQCSSTCCTATTQAHFVDVSTACCSVPVAACKKRHSPCCNDVSKPWEPPCDETSIGRYGVNKAVSANLRRRRTQNSAPFRDITERWNNQNATQEEFLYVRRRKLSY